MSYTLNYTGSEIDDILDRAAPGGAIDQALATKQDALTFDAVPTEGSTNPAESGGIYDAIQAGGAAALAAFPTDTVSGDVVSFPDGADGIPVKAFTGSIIPAQDLNGQSAPYPAGGGKNKLNSEATSATHNGVTYTVNADYTISTSGTASGGLSVKNIINGKTLAESNLVEGASYVLNGCPSGGSASGYYLRLAFTTSGGTTNYTDTGSGVSFTVPSGVTGVRVYIGVSVGVSANSLVFKPMIRLATEADATFAPYSNICPISGWTGETIVRRGANLIPAYNDGGSQRGVTASIDADGFFHVTGTSTATSTAILALTDAFYLPEGTYTLTGCPSGLTGLNLQFSAGTNYYDYGDGVTINHAGGLVSIRLRLQSTSNGQTYNATFRPMVALGSVGETPVLPNSTTYPIDFGQTVYGGTLNVTTGVLTVTHVGVDMGSLTTWNYRAAKNAFDATAPGMVDGIIGTVADILCSTYPATASKPFSTWQDAPDKSIFASSSESARIVVRDTAYTSIESFRTAVTGQTLVYPIATPQVYQLTPTQIDTLLGSNTVWTDVGAVTEMEYRADTALYIQKLLNGGGTLSTLSMASPSPSLSLGRVGVLAEPEEAEPEQTDEEAEQAEQTEEPEQTEEAEEE